MGRFYADMHGWDAIAATLIETHRRLPSEERTATRILAPDYGVAGAVELLGRK